MLTEDLVDGRDCAGIYRDIIIESDYDPLAWRLTDPVKIGVKRVSMGDPIKKELTLQVRSHAAAHLSPALPAACIGCSQCP